MGELVEGGDGVAERASVLYMFPGESGEGGAQRRDRSVDRTDEHGLAVQL